MLGFAWKVLFPLATVNIVVTAAEVLIVQAMFNLEPGEALPIAGLAGMSLTNIGITAAVLMLLPRFTGFRGNPISSVGRRAGAAKGAGG